MEIDERGFEVLDGAQCADVLRRAQWGRIALTDHALPIILPVGFASFGGDLVFGAEATALARAAAARHVVCFEADGFDDPTGEVWSVSMIGQLAPVTGCVPPAVMEGIRAAPWSNGTTTFARLTPEIVAGRRRCPAHALH